MDIKLQPMGFVGSEELQPRDSWKVVFRVSPPEVAEKVADTSEALFVFHVLVAPRWNATEPEGPSGIAACVDKLSGDVSLGRWGWFP